MCLKTLVVKENSGIVDNIQVRSLKLNNLEKEENSFEVNNKIRLPNVFLRLCHHKSLVHMQ